MSNKEKLITSEDWNFFKDAEDAVTKSPFRIGDLVVKCAACKQIYHVELVENENCPACNRHLVCEEIVTSITIHPTVPPDKTPGTGTGGGPGTGNGPGTGGGGGTGNGPGTGGGGGTGNGSGTGNGGGTGGGPWQGQGEARSKRPVDRLVNWLTAIGMLGVIASVLLLFAGAAHGWLPAIPTMFSASSMYFIPGYFLELFSSIQALIVQIAVPQAERLWREGVAWVSSTAVWLWQSLSRTVVETADGVVQGISHLFG